MPGVARPAVVVRFIRSTWCCCRAIGRRTRNICCCWAMGSTWICCWWCMGSTWICCWCIGRSTCCFWVIEPSSCCRRSTLCLCGGLNWRRRRWRRRKATKPCGWTMHPLPFEAVQLGLDFGKLPLALGQLQIAHPFVPHVASAKLQVGQNILVVPWAKDATTHLRSQCSLIGCHLETAEQLHVVPAPIRHVVQHHPIAAKEGALFLEYQMKEFFALS